VLKLCAVEKSKSVAIDLLSERFVNRWNRRRVGGERGPEEVFKGLQEKRAAAWVTDRLNFSSRHNGASRWSE